MLQNTIQNLYLPIGLGVGGCAHTEFGATEFEKVLSKATDKYGITIRHKASRHTMVFADEIKE